MMVIELDEGVGRMFKKLLVFVVIVFLAGCASMQAGETSKSSAGATSKPEITNAYASKEIRLGDIWKIYINASDPNSEIKYVVATIDQPGRGVYQPGLTRIKGSHELSGYVYWKAPDVEALNFTNITLKLQIKDKAGNYSNEVSFPLHFTTTARQEPPAPGVFQDRNLGPVMIGIRALGDQD